MALGTLGNTTVFKIGDKTTGIAVAEVTSVNGIELSRGTIETTALADEYKTFIGGVKDGGDVAIEGNFLSTDTTGQIALQTAFEDNGAADYSVIFPTSITADWAFSGVMTKFKVGDYTEDGLIMFNASFKVSGKPILTIGV